MRQIDVEALRMGKQQNVEILNTPGKQGKTVLPDPGGWRTRRQPNFSAFHQIRRNTSETTEIPQRKRGRSKKHCPSRGTGDLAYSTPAKSAARVLRVGALGSLLIVLVPIDRPTGFSRRVRKSGHPLRSQSGGVPDCPGTRHPGGHPCDGRLSRRDRRE